MGCLVKGSWSIFFLVVMLESNINWLRCVEICLCNVFIVFLVVFFFLVDVFVDLCLVLVRVFFKVWWGLGWMVMVVFLSMVFGCVVVMMINFGLLGWGLMIGYFKC